MPKRSSIRRGDINRLAKIIADVAISNFTPEQLSGKNPAAVALGRLGGLKGGVARLEKLSAARRAEIATKAAKARWAK